MKCKRLNEVLELLKEHWEQEPDLNLMQLIEKLSIEAGFSGNLPELTDDVLIYQMKMRHSKVSEAIPGLKKDYEDDFKTALLQARGILKD